MKKCPFCAEEIQDAAIVCKHCGRDVVGPNSGKVIVGRAPRKWPGVLAVGIAILVAIAAVGALMPAKALNTHDSEGKCILSAEPSIMRGGDIGIGNRDGEDWRDVVVNVYGLGTTPQNSGQATGMFTASYDNVPTLKRRTIPLSDLQKPDGSRWQSTSMRPDLVKITARLRGEACQFEGSLK